MNRQLKMAVALTCLLVSNLAVSAENHIKPSCDPENRGQQDSTCFGNMIASIEAPVAPAPTKNIAPPPIRPFAVPGNSCTTPWGEMVADGGGVDAFYTPKSIYDMTNKSWAIGCVEEYRSCVNGTLSGSYKFKTCELEPVNGSCGSANGQYYTYPTSGPVSNLCNPETTYGGIQPTDDSLPGVPASSGVELNGGSNTYNWTCKGEAGGTTANCMAYRRINGQCGGSINDCALGNLAGQSSTNVYYPTYQCNCTVDPISGVTSCMTCGGSYSHTVYNWQCVGINTGSNASCSANGGVTPPTPPTPPVEPPTCANGASDYPTCTPTPPTNGLGSANGASFSKGWSNYDSGLITNDANILNQIISDGCSTPNSSTNITYSLDKQGLADMSTKTYNWTCGADQGTVYVFICGGYQNSSSSHVACN